MVNKFMLLTKTYGICMYIHTYTYICTCTRTITTLQYTKKTQKQGKG